MAKAQRMGGLYYRADGVAVDAEGVVLDSAVAATGKAPDPPVAGPAADDTAAPPKVADTGKAPRERKAES